MAAGDIALTTPKSIPTLPLGDIHISVLPSAFMTLTFFEVDARGTAHVVSIDNTRVAGFDYTGGVFTDGVARALAGYLTTILGVLFIGNATTLNQRKTALVQRLVADGVITGTFTVG